jgi:alkylation response protein AidB-like acyl-CoA dehydrogenase
MPDLIPALLQEFLVLPAVERERLDTPEGADGMCHWAAGALLRYAKERRPDLELRIVETLGHAHDPCFWHCFAKIGDTYCDLTLRQIEPAAAFPYVTRTVLGWRWVKEHPFPYQGDPFILCESPYTDV